MISELVVLVLGWWKSHFKIWLIGIDLLAGLRHYRSVRSESKRNPPEVETRPDVQGGFLLGREIKSCLLKKDFKKQAVNMLIPIAVNWVEAASDSVSADAPLAAAKYPAWLYFD